MDKTLHSDVISKYELDAVDKTILRLVLSHVGITDAEIAAVVNLTRKQVNHRRNAPKFKKAHNEYLMEPLELLRAQLKKAARVLVKLLDSSNEKIRADVAFRLLLSEGVLKREADLSQNAQSSGVIIIKHIAGGTTMIGQETAISKNLAECGGEEI